MKTYQQMAFEVLKARDAYQLKHQRRMTGFKFACPVALSFSFAVLIGLNVWKEKEQLPQIQTISDSPVITETIPETEPETASELKSESLPEVKPVPTAESPEMLPQMTTEALAEITEPATEVSEIIPVTELVTEEIFIQETEAPEIVEVLPETQALPEQIPTEAEPITEAVSETVQEEVPLMNSTTGGLQRIFLHLPERLNSYGTDGEQEVPFQATGMTISSEYIGEWFDTVDVNMHYPDGSTELLEHVGEAYLIQDVSCEAMAAVQFEGEENYYLFRRETLTNEEFQKLLADSGILK